MTFMLAYSNLLLARGNKMKQSCEFNPSPNLSIIQKQNEVKFVALQFMNKLPCPIIYIPQKQLQKITHYRAYYKNNHISSNKCLSTYLKFSLKLWRGILVEARWFSFQRTVILLWLILITKKKTTSSTLTSSQYSNVSHLLKQSRGWQSSIAYLY